jgi:hypothetical protein
MVLVFGGNSGLLPELPFSSNQSDQRTPLLFIHAPTRTSLFDAQRARTDHLKREPKSASAFVRAGITSNVT